MSQKAICPRGHIWDPSTLAGLPPTERPRCPICGEEEPLRASNALKRLSRWCQSNPVIAGLSVPCLLLVVALIGIFLQQRSRLQETLAKVEQAQFETRQAEAKSHSHRQAAEVEDKELLLKRQAEMQTARWNDREKEFQSQLREAEKATRAVRRQRDDEISQHKLTKELKQTADQLRQEAVDRRAEASRKLAKMYVGQGNRLMEKGDLPSSLLWFAEALRLAEGEKLPTETHRLRLAAVLAQCPRPLRMWLPDKKINVVQLSPDGKRVVIAGANGVVEVRDTATGKRIREPLAHMEAVTHAVFSPDGKRVLTAAADMTLHLWDIERGQEVFAAQQLQGPVVGLAFSGDGKRFLTVTDKAPMGATEVQLHVRDAASGEAIRETALGSDLSPSLARFSPDGKRILTICEDRSARVWDIATGKQIGPALSHSAALIHASYSGDGERVLTAAGDGTARVWLTKSGAAATPIFKHGASLRGACLSPAGSHVLTFGDDRLVRVWDVNKGEAAGPGLRNAEALSDALFSSDGRYVLTTADDGAARLWDYRTGQEVLPQLWHGQAIAYAAFTPAGDRVLTRAGQTVRLWDLTAGEHAMPPAPPSESGLVVFSSDGKRVLRATEKAVRVFDTVKNEPIGGTLPHPHKVTAAAFSADGKRLLTVSHQPNGDELEGHIRVWETETGQLLGQPLVHPRSVLEATFSRDGRRVLTACQDGKARLWDVDKNALVGEPMEHKEDLRRALFVPDGKHLVTVDAEGGLRLWDANSAEAVGPTWGHRKPINQLIFSPDGQQLAAACADGTASVWVASTGHEIATTPVQGAPVLHVAFSADGKRLVTVNEARQARIWDAVNAKPLSAQLRHRAAVSLAVFSEDGKRIVTVAADGIRIWDAASGEPMGPLVKHGEELPAIRAAVLNRDERLILSSGAMSDPASRWSLDFRAEERPVADVLRVAELLSAQRMADAGETTALDPAELNKAWQDVQTKYGKDFSPSPGRLAAWHRRGTLECERQQWWIGSLHHLDSLMPGGASVDLYARRGRANLELRRWESAKADYTKALAGNVERWDLWAGRATVESALGRWPEAAADFSEAIQRQGDRAELWTARGRIEAEQGDWRKAAADLGKAIHLGAQDATVWRQHILALLASGDEVNYRRWCGRLLQRFGVSKDEEARRAVLWTCALSEGAVRDWAALVRQAEQTATANPQSSGQRRILALVLYRAGQFDAARKHLQEVVDASHAKPLARDGLVMALAAQRLGHGDDAKKWLEKAEQIRRDRGKDDKESWEDRLIDDTLRREAQALVKGDKR